MDGTALTGWMYSSTMEDGTPGAPWVAQILGCPCMGALAPKNGCKMAIGRGCVRPPPGPETAQKRLKLAIKTGSGTQNCYFQLDRPAWVSENVFCTPGARKPPPTALPGAKKPETPKNAIKPFGSQWILEASGRRAALQHRPTADSGRANGWRTIGGMWSDRVRSYTIPNLALGPRLRCVLAEGVDFTTKIWCAI